ncbi:hypothetical protein [Hymenobacter metallicola]|uniref:Uncharacterized protein n=1 Tax=Hymenobacter metallicola TaxID=2563114 RepID=A0A4Z0PUC6_9BACT|nr:hypothetical protein [Hymenobacter metallicola]TGE20889.1 hypothetical protein E5K02_25130 [Hymenobacter metallicola]
MIVYFDKENLESLLRSRSVPSYGDVERMIKNQLNIKFNFTKAAIHSGTNGVGLANYATQITSGRGEQLNHEFLEEQYPARPVKQNAHTHFDHITRPVMLVNDERTAAYRDINACLIGEVGQEVEVLSRLQKRGGDYEFESKLYIGEPEFRNWDHLRPYCLPCYDVIISDRYLLLQDDDTIRANYPKLLENLLYDKQIKVNIVLIVLRRSNNREVSWTFEQIKKLTKDKVKALTGKAPNFTLVWANDPKNVRHDRHIITNYQWLQSGDTFNYFSATGNLLSEGDTLTINSLARAEHRRGANLILNRFQTRIDNVRALNPDYVQGDRVSSFLTF